MFFSTPTATPSGTLEPKGTGMCKVNVASSEVQDQLKGVQQVQATDFAFAAILAEGSVVTWGNPGSGGDSSVAAAQCAYV